MANQRRRAAPVLVLSFCLLVSHASGQETQPQTQQRGPGTQPTEPVLQPPGTTQPVASYPLELLGLLAPPARRGGVTLTPSIAIGEEYNDNIFLNNANRQSDFITTFAPALTLYAYRPQYELSAGYSFGADIYAKNSALTDAFNRQNFLGSALYRVSSALTLTASDSFAFNRSTNLVTTQGFSTGRQESWGNTVTPGLNWLVTPKNTLNLSASYTALRFLGGGVGVDSNTYGFQSSITHSFTPRFGGILGYGFTYLDAGGQEASKTHTPSVGLSYQLTPTLSATVSGGPAITQIGGDTTISPAAMASIVQTFSFGSASLQYVRAVGAAGGFGGTTDTQTASGTLTLSSLQRGLIVVFSPSYSTAETLNTGQTGQGGRVDVKAFSIGLSAFYQIAQYTSLFGGYTFLHQRTGGSSTFQADADQNRVRFGVQFGYPINFD